MSDSVTALSTAPPKRTHRWIALIVLLIAVAVDLIGVTAINVALPSLAEGFGASSATISWVVSGYLAGFAIALVPGGVLGDRFGHRLIFVVGTALFVVSGLFAVFAWSEPALVIARLVHGVAAGLMIAAVFALIQVLFTGVYRVRAFGILTVVAGLAALAGPLIAGFAIEFVGILEGWRWTLAASLPLAVIALILVPLSIPRGQKSALRGFDLGGIILINIAIFAVLFPLIQVVDANLPPWALISFAVAVVAAILLVLVERSRERRGHVVVLPIGLFRRPPVSLGLVSMVLAWAAFSTAIYITLSLLWQGGRLETALAAAIVTVPFSVGSMIGAALSDRAAVRLSRWVVPFSLALLTAGYLVTWGLVTSDPYVSLWVLVAPLFVAGMGSGVFVAPNTSAVLATVPERDVGALGAFVVTVQRVGAALGSAVIIMVLSHPGSDGGFGPAAFIETGTRSILLCAVFAGLALIVSVIDSIVSRGYFAKNVLERGDPTS